MNPSESARIIEAAGGDKAFAALLGIEHEVGVAQRVNNWKRRGIPATVLLEHQDVIREIRVAKPVPKPRRVTRAVA